MEDIIKSFPKTIIGDEILLVPLCDDIMVPIKLNCSECVAWDKKGTEYSKKNIRSI